MPVVLSNASPAINCILKFDDGTNVSPPVVTTVGELRTLPGPAMSATVQKTTNHSSSTPWEEILPTLLAAGGMLCQVNFDHTNASHDNTVGVMSIFTSRSRRRWYLYLPDGTLLFACKGYCTKINPGPFAVDGVQLMSFEITFTSIPSILGSSAW